jgi:hypothetical protein
MRSIRDPSTRGDIIRRLEALSPDNRRLWGMMELPRMIAHLGDQIRIALGDIAVRRVYGPLRFAPTRYLVLHVMPWPKAKAKSPPEALTTQPTDFDSDRTTLLSLIERFAATPEADLVPVHPLFGRMTARDWDVLTWRHIDHHLRQFDA